jgi:uncharacterized OB-fold protein
MSLPVPTPLDGPESAPFRDALGEGRLVLPRCDACGQLIWYPRSWCPACGNDTVTWTELSGQGTVHARTILRKGMGPWKPAAPYVVAYVELAEGPRLLVNIEADDVESVEIGTPVVATYVPTEDGAATVLRFTPAG